MERYLIVFVFCFLSIMAIAQQKDTVVFEQPNIVMILSNGHGLKDLGCFGSKSIKTPNLDKLAAAGIKMENVYAASANTSANYSVILTGIMSHASGQYGSANGFNHFSVFPEIKSLPRYLTNAGYRTAQIGMFPLLFDSVFRFDTFLGQAVNMRNSFEMAERSAEFVTKQNDKPFFLFFSLEDPSRSYENLDDIKFHADRFGSREEGYEGIIPKFYKPSKMELPYYLPDIPETREEFAQYAQAITRLDHGVGRLLEVIQKSGVWDNTLIIYISSNGPYFPGVQNNLNEANMHLPMIVKPPHYFKKNGICDAMISFSDIAPTILDIANAIPEEYAFHGRTFSHIMLEDNPSGWDEVYASQTFEDVNLYYPMRAVQTRKYKLIWNIAWQLPFTMSNKMLSSASWLGMVKWNSQIINGKSFHDYIQRSEFELYDLDNDPLERSNVVANPLYQEVFNKLKLKIKDFQVNTNDPWIVNWSKP